MRALKKPENVGMGKNFTKCTVRRTPAKDKFSLSALLMINQLNAL